MTATTIVISAIALTRLVIASFGVRELLRARQSASWPAVDGIITSSRIESGRGNWTFSPSIRYAYSVGGREFVGSRIGFGIANIYGPRSFAEPFVTRYPAQAAVEVYYNPVQPSESALEPGLHRRTFFLFTGGLTFTFFACWFGFLGWLLRP